MRLLFTSLACLISVSVVGQSPCSNQTSITYQGYEYDIVEIGDQCWFAENCRYLPSVSPSNEGDVSEPYYYVNGYEGWAVPAAKQTYNYQTYGVLYNWPAVMTDDLCPSGWNIPSDDEWDQLRNYLGEATAGIQMKSVVGWEPWPGNLETNTSGFSGHPGGMVNSNGSGNIGYSAWFWSSSSGPGFICGSDSPHRVNLNYASDVLAGGCEGPSHGYSARCVTDQLIISGCTDSNAINYNSEATQDDGSCCFDCGAIEGFVYQDMDSNDMYDNTVDQPMSNQILQLENDGEFSYLSTQPNGLYAFVVDTGMQTLSYFAPPNWQLNSDINEYDIDISVNNTIENLDFGISPIQTKSDLAIDLTTSTHVCSMTSNLWLNIKNDGTETVNGVNVELWVNPYSGIVSYSSGGEVFADNYVSWTIDGDFFPYVYSNQDTTLLVEIMTPGVGAMGSILVDSARVSTVQPNLLELQYSNNFSRADGEVMCSYDPNDKQALPLECFNEPLDTLEYTIRFQNTGNYPATTVTLVDTLDLEKLDIMSLEILGGSHDYEWALRSPSVLEVVFNNINLVDSSVSFSESQGFIKYGIRVREELPDDSPTATPAYIFFDNNPPIVTNEPEVRFFSNLSVSVEANDVSCFGEDDGEAMLNISSGESPYHIQWSNGEEEESISNLPPGEYSVEIIDAYTCTSTLDFEIDEFFCPSQYDGNGDGCVNVHDILDFLLEYGNCTPEFQIVYDGNLDGCSNSEDLLNMLSVYGQCE